MTVACPCGVTFERWVTELAAAEDLRRLELRACARAPLSASQPPAASRHGVRSYAVPVALVSVRD